MNFEAVLRHVQVINALSRSLIGRPAFEEVYVQLPDPAQPETGFIRATSWLYCFYFESGQVTLGFLSRLGTAYQRMDRDFVTQHIETVRCLRTELHHNLGFEDSDRQAREIAERWRRKACASAFPKTKRQWSDCYKKLVEEARQVCSTLEAIVRRLESDSEGASQLAEWTRCLMRSWPAASFDPLVDDAASRLGRSALRTVAFRNRHLDRWRKALELLEDGFDFEREATLLIEKTLLDDDSCVLPITGHDIMVNLGVSPGPRVGTLLNEARRFYTSSPCGPDKIMEHLRNFLTNGSD